MKRIELIRVGIFLCLAAVVSLPASGQQEVIVSDGEEGIVLDKKTGDYVIMYFGYSRESYGVVFVPATKIDPVARRYGTEQ